MAQAQPLRCLMSLSASFLSRRVQRISSYPWLIPSRVAAVGTVVNNVPEASAKVEKHVKATAESMLSVQPDLVLVPNWMTPDAIGEMRNMQIPVYVYKTPTTVEEAKSVIHEIAGLLHASDENHDC